MFQIDPNILAERALYVGGEWVKGSGEPLISVNPATGESNATFATASEADVDHAVNVAHASLQSSGWADMQPHRRADHLHAIARLLLDRVEPLAQIAMRENGKTLAESRQQVRGAAGIFRYYASLCETLGSEVTPSRGEHLSFTLYEPWGVVAAVTPWNSPVNLAAEKLAPALAAGNAVVLKRRKARIRSSDPFSRTGTSFTGWYRKRSKKEPAYSRAGRRRKGNCSARARFTRPRFSMVLSR